MLKECVRAKEKERARESKNIIEGSLERRIYIYIWERSRVIRMEWHVLPH